MRLLIPLQQVNLRGIYKISAEKFGCFMENAYLCKQRKDI